MKLKRARALWKMKAGERILVTQSAKATFREEIKRDWVVGRAPQRPDCGIGQSVEVRGEFVHRIVSRPEARCWEWYPMVCAGFLRRPWEKPIWEGAWPYLDPWDSVCLRTASVERNVPAKYGPHGELFFFLIDKELATMRGQTFSPFFGADIRTLPHFSADVLKKCALIACTEWRKREEAERVVVKLLLQETCGDTVARRVQCGKVRVKLGLKTQAFLQVILERTMCATKRCTSSGCMGLVTRSLSLSLLEGFGACEGGVKLSHGPGLAVPGDA